MTTLSRVCLSSSQKIMMRVSIDREQKIVSAASWTSFDQLLVEERQFVGEHRIDTHTEMSRCVQLIDAETARSVDVRVALIEHRRELYWGLGCLRGPSRACANSQSQPVEHLRTLHSTATTRTMAIATTKDEILRTDEPGLHVVRLNGFRVDLMFDKAVDSGCALGDSS